MNEVSISRKFAWQEILLVLGVSLGASALYSLVQLFESLISPTGLGGSSTSLNTSESASQYFDLTYQLLGIGLALVPVFLALYLLIRSNPEFSVGLLPDRGSDFLRALALAAAIGIPGLALYYVARLTGLAAQVIASSENPYWWTLPVLLLSAARAALQEEVIMIGFLYKRLEQLGFSFAKRQAFSASIRAAYHAYQGFGGLIGNAVLGLVFGWCYRRWGRVAPLVVAHFILDAVVFVGYALLAKQLATFGF
jgi:membrane protease YdiL (CAAX protease family)